jgi:sterol desaturase/sphingolipid hydroxylase (fatty acid hydroxylase superfamily)
MVKRILYPVLQFAAFLGLLYFGGEWDFVNLGIEIKAMQNHTTPNILIPTFKTQLGAHTLIADGIIFATVLLLLILLIQAIAKRLKPWAVYTIGAYVLSVIVAYAAKMGLPPSS